MENKKKREFYRYELNIPVWLEIEPEIGEPQRERCNIINISQKGIMFEAKSAFKKEKRLGVRFFLPRFGAPVRGTIKVIWTKEIVAGKLYRIGGEFVELVNADQEQFRRIAENYPDNYAAATICPSCGYMKENISLNQVDFQLLEMIMGLNDDEKNKVMEYIASLFKEPQE